MRGAEGAGRPVLTSWNLTRMFMLKRAEKVKRLVTGSCARIIAGARTSIEAATTNLEYLFMWASRNRCNNHPIEPAGDGQRFALRFGRAVIVPLRVRSVGGDGWRGRLPALHHIVTI